MARECGMKGCESEKEVSKDRSVMDSVGGCGVSWVSECSVVVERAEVGRGSGVWDESLCE